MVLPKTDINSLIIFYFVANEASVTAAADKLFLTQPTVTYHIKSLENSIGLKLLDVKKQKVYLTPAGTGLFNYAKEIYQKIIEAEKYLQNLKETSFRVGTAATFSWVVASAAATFEENYPTVKLIVTTASSLEIAEYVVESAVDVGIVVSRDYNNSRLKTIPVSIREQLVLVAAPSSSIFSQGRVQLTDLQNYPIIAGPETSATRQLYLKMLENAGLKVSPSVMVEANSLELGLSLVESGKGMGLYHTGVVRDKITEGRLKMIPLATEIYVGADVLVRSDTPIHPYVEKFVSLVKDRFRNQQSLVKDHAQQLL